MLLDFFAGAIKSNDSDRHAGELPLLFGTYVRQNGTEVDASVSASMQKKFADFIKNPQSGPGWEQWPQLGVLGISDGQAVTTTHDAMDYNPVCAEYERLWMTTELTALTQSPQLQDSANDGSQSEGSVPNSAPWHVPSLALCIMSASSFFVPSLL